MKIIGLLGGMSWESTALYYRLMNEEVRRLCGGLHSARILLHSVDFHEIEQRQHRCDWDGTADILTAAAQGLAAGGADFLVIATNTMHKVIDEIAAASRLDILHIATPTGQALQRDGIGRVALLGTRFTMEQDFFRQRLVEDYGLVVDIPEAKERDDIHRIIYEELCMGITLPASAERFSAIIDAMKTRGAEAVILGCTEITMIVTAETSPLPVYDTTALHARAAVARALEG